MEGDSQTWLELKSTRHARYWRGYHFVWIPKYRREVLPDHVHVFCSCPSRLSPAYVVNYLKCKSARRLLQRFPELKAGASGVSCGLEATSLQRLVGCQRMLLRGV